MNRNVLKMTAAAMSAVLVLGIGATATAAQKPRSDEAAEPTAVTEPARRTGRAAKDETVYILADAEGSAGKVLVSSWLSNPEKADVLEDVANLSDIENVKGEESFTEGPDGSLSWQANGADIYYQGTSDRQVPVEIRISYQLDGTPISARELAGQSGHVTMRFDYENHQTETVTINGKKQEIAVPFVMVTGVLLDPELFRNVVVTNAKLENLGNEIAVLGIALPGMQENLNMEDLELPDFVEIQADVEQFELGPTMTLATTSLTDHLDSESLNIDDLKAQAEQLTDGMNQLMDGSNQLYDGLNTLLNQTQTLVEGVSQLAAGATRLQAGADALRGGASQLQAGAAQLSEGLTTLDSKSAELNGGATQVFNSLLANANTQIAAAGLEVATLTIGNYAQVLSDAIASLDETAVYQAALQQVTAAVEARRGEIEAAVTEAVREQVSTEVTAQVAAAVRETVTQKVQEKEPQFREAVIQKAVGMSVQEYELAVRIGLVTEEQQAAVEEAIVGAMAAEVENQMESEAIQAQIAEISSQKTEEKMQDPEIQALIAENTEMQVQKAISETMASPEIQEKLQAAAEGAQSLIALKASLDSYHGFYLGVQAYTAGVGTATTGSRDLIAGANALKGGMDSLSTGANELNSGIQTLKGKTPAMMDGIKALRDGSAALKDGLTRLMQEGIQKIADLAQKDLENLTARLSAVIDVGREYRSFSGLAEGTEGTVKFIYRTDSIEPAAATTEP